MWPVSPSWLAALGKSHGRYTRVEAWYGGALVASFKPESGSVQVTARNRVRRSLTAVLQESAWPLTTTSSLAPYGAQLKVWQGVVGANGALVGPEVPVFTGRVETVRRDRLSGRITVTGNDPFADVNDDQFDQPRVAPAGADVVQTIIRLIGEARPDAHFADLTNTVALLPAQIVWDTDRGQAVDDLAASIGAEVFFQPDLTCVIRPVPTILNAPAWSLVQGQGSTVVRDAASLSRTDVPNKVVVRVEVPGQTPILVPVVDAAPDSLTRFGGPYGQVVRYYSNPMIANTSVAYTAGVARLARAVGATRTRDLDTVPNPALEAGDVITVATSEGSERHIADSFGVPFAVTDVMTINTRSTQPTN